MNVIRINLPVVVAYEMAENAVDPALDDRQSSSSYIFWFQKKIFNSYFNDWTIIEE